MKRIISNLLILSLFTILIAGCAAKTEEAIVELEAAVTETEEVVVETEVVITPEMILADGVNHMASLPGFEFGITYQGQPVYLDADQTIYLESAAGHYVSPDQAITTVTINIFTIPAQITVISLQETQWASNPLTGAFQELPPEYLFKPTLYLDPEAGFFPSLQAGITDLVLVGEEELESMPGLVLTHLSGSIPGEVILDISKGLINIEFMQGDIWLDPTRDEVHRVVLTDISADGLAGWTFDFWNFGATIEISPP